MATKDLTPYEKRLAAVMAQLDIKDYAFDYTQQEAWLTAFTAGSWGCLPHPPGPRLCGPERRL